MKHTLTYATLLLAPVLTSRAADFKIAAIFSDHMVLQREKPVPVWGWADAGEKVSIAFAGQKKSATADAEGKWTAKLDALPANDQGETLAVTSEKSEHKIEFKDVLVGEVWLGSGQSNMAFNMKSVRNADQEAAAANLPLIRGFKEESPGAKTAQPDAKGKWVVCTPESVGGFSAVLFFLGRELHRELKVPVGLINSSVGGTPIESWIDTDVQAGSAELKATTEAMVKDSSPEAAAKAKAFYERAVAGWERRAAKAKEAGQPIPPKPRDPSVTRERKGGIGNLFNGKIAPLIPFAIRGAIWYQGEANSRPGKGVAYQYQLPLLVTDWRARWGEEFPFAWVQLPNYAKSSEDWCLVREAELKSLRLPHTGMAITVDVGEPDNIHPKNKQEVGRRLSYWALGEVYHQKVAATSGPLPGAHDIEGGKVSVSFKHTEGGLKAKDGELKGFKLAGDNKEWKPATATIEGDKVIVTSSEVPHPVALRYAWEQNPDCNLCNGAGIPASPFRTDDWPVIASPAAPKR